MLAATLVTFMLAGEAAMNPFNRAVSAFGRSAATQSMGNRAQDVVRRFISVRFERDLDGDCMGQLDRDEVAQFARSVLPDTPRAAAESAVHYIMSRLDVDCTAAIDKDHFSDAVIDSLARLNEDERRRVIRTMSRSCSRSRRELATASH